MAQAGVALAGGGEEAGLFGALGGVVEVGNMRGEDVGVGGGEARAAAGLGDALHRGAVGVHVLLLHGELGLDVDRQSFLCRGGVGGEELFGGVALEGQFDAAGGDVAEGGAVVAGGVGELGEVGLGDDSFAGAGDGA